MKFIHPHPETLNWILYDLYRFWKNDNWPLGCLDRKIKFLFFKEPKNDLLEIDFNQPKEMVILQIHNLLSYLNFPVELEKIYWEYINS
jgi:hypothetical protein